MTKLAQDIFDTMKKSGSATVADASARFFKEPVNFLGPKSADINRIQKSYMPQIKQLPRESVFALAGELMKKNYMESTSMAANIVYSVRAQFQPDDFYTFYKWLNQYITNWANCDILCNHSVNALLEMYPELPQKIYEWTQSDNRWVRRGAAVSFILSARHGRFIDEVFKISDALLCDTDEMVQKGYGWALKAAGEFAPQRVYDFVAARHDKMPRTAFRYAIEKLPPEMRASAMGL